MNQPSGPSICPVCEEPVKANWRICPVCETQLQKMVCPLCGIEIKPNWRRCPECEALLVCPQCGKRLKTGEAACFHCHPEERGVRDLGPVFRDPVCGVELVRVNGGTFQMGDTLDQGTETEKPDHEVTLDTFYMARFPVTQAQWQVLMAENPSAFPNPENPVEQVTWFEAAEFARKLSEASKDSLGYALPTEAQWEFAARAGGRDDLYAGGGNIEAVAWYEANSKGRPHPVGQKQPNALGLYDMSGNVWEWCRDAFQADAYQRYGVSNPCVASEEADADRVIRGGGWNLDAWSARCARRFSFRADLLGPALGFRLVLLV